MSHNENPSSADPASPQNHWYDLFSRGARDWLRHNEKVRDSVRQGLPELIANADVISQPHDRTVRVPVKFLEHYRFRLNDPENQSGAGQGQPGQVKPGDILRPAQGPGQGRDKGAGQGEGGVEFVLELKIDDIVDWLWEELKLPNLQPRPSDVMVDEDLIREGWDRRGARSRLDRRRTMKEAIKRRSVQADGPDFSNEDLRFRQLARRQRPATNAVVFFALDASSSMSDEDRKLAKTFFFWVLQGLHRHYMKINTVFIAHTITAWEFSEPEFFQVTAAGGTQASSAFKLVQDIQRERFEANHYNSYLFYASDGDNFLEDQEAATTLLHQLAVQMNFTGYIEIARSRIHALDTPMGLLFSSLAESGLPVGSYPVTVQDDIWEGIRKFFVLQTGQEAA